MNKGRRHELKILHYKKRIKRFVTNSHPYITGDGNRIYNPKAIDIINDNGHSCYRTSSTPCSCSLCSAEKYNRAKEKINSLTA